MKKVLTIAGSDCSGGAGIQADIKTIMAHGMYAMSVITALTAQNTTGVYGVVETDPEFVGKQLDCIFQDISPDAVKIGMVSNLPNIQMIAVKLKEYEAKNIVIDPVMISTSGSRLLKDDARKSLLDTLLPMADVITPNLLEAGSMCEFPIKTAQEMEKAAIFLENKLHTNVLIKGGHLEGKADDLLYSEGYMLWFPGEKVNNPNTHGTGCTLSAAMACHLADGASIAESVRLAKQYVTGALTYGLNLGKERGPLHHGYELTKEHINCFISE